MSGGCTRQGLLTGKNADGSLCHERSRSAKGAAMFCTECGHKIGAVRFCGECGAPAQQSRSVGEGSPGAVQPPGSLPGLPQSPFPRNPADSSRQSETMSQPDASAASNQTRQPDNVPTSESRTSRTADRVAATSKAAGLSGCLMALVLWIGLPLTVILIALALSGSTGFVLVAGSLALVAAAIYWLWKQSGS